MSVGALIACDARADDTLCNSSMSGTLGNIVVPADAECDLSDATVNGNIIQQSGSNLFLEGNVTVNGNISSHGGQIIAISPLNAGTPEIVGNVKIESNNQVEICGARIDGNVEISNTNPAEVMFGGSDNSKVPAGPKVPKGMFGGCASKVPKGGGAGGNIIGGNVKITNNDVQFLQADDNVVGKNLIITDNFGSGTEQVVNNAVKGNLTCSGNGVQFVSSGNTAKNLIGECQP
jgi:hypothetical protein